MSELDAIAPGLRRREDGIWVAARRAAVSYPEDGHARYRELEETSFWFAHRNACIVAALRGFPPGGPVFDVGGGNGIVSLALERAGFEAVLVEPGPRGAENARARGLPRVVCSTLEEADFRPGTLPAVGLFDVIEHLPDEVGFLRRTARLLAPGGRVYLTVPAHGWLWSGEDEYAGHQRRYSLGALRGALEAAGLEVEYQTYLFALLPLPIFLLRVVPGRLGRRRGEWNPQVAHEHEGPGGLAGRALDRTLALELRAVAQQRRLPFGSSCLAVARVATSG